MRKFVFVILIGLLAIQVFVIAGCQEPQFEPYKPHKVTVEPYNPEPAWNPNTDPFLIRVQDLKKETGVQPTTTGTGTGTGTSTVTGTGTGNGTGTGK